MPSARENLVDQFQLIIVDDPARRQLFARQQHGFVHRQPRTGIQALRHVADACRAFFRVLQDHLARAVDQPGHAFEQRRFARRIGPDHRDHLAADKRRRGHAANDLALAIAGTKIFQLQLHHEFFFPPRIRDMKNGTPISEVTTPMGKIAPGIRVLLTTELADRINEPVSNEAGKKNR